MKQVQFPIRCPLRPAYSPVNREPDGCTLRSSTCTSGISPKDKRTEFISMPKSRLQQRALCPLSVFRRTRRSVVPAVPRSVLLVSRAAPRESAAATTVATRWRTSSASSPRPSPSVPPRSSMPTRTGTVRLRQLRPPSARTPHHTLARAQTHTDTRRHQRRALTRTRGFGVAAMWIR